MSHNPNTINSQDELNPCNDGKRSSEVLLSTIDKIVEVEEWNKDMQAKYGNLSAELEKTKKQLEIALDGLFFFASDYDSGDDSVNEDIKSCVDDFLARIEELNEIHKQA